MAIFKIADRFKLDLSAVLKYSLREIMYLLKYIQREEIFEFFKLAASAGNLKNPDQWLEQRLAEWDLRYNEQEVEEPTIKSVEAEDKVNSLLGAISGK